ncbi:hypothetical protein U1Q18_021287 [Sarracenia purpurea var. burkii]
MVARWGLHRRHVRNVSRRDDPIVGLEDFDGGGRRRCDDQELSSESERDEGAVGAGEVGQGYVRVFSDVEEIAENRPWIWTWRQWRIFCGESRFEMVEEEEGDEE